MIQAPNSNKRYHSDLIACKESNCKERHITNGVVTSTVHLNQEQRDTIQTESGLSVKSLKVDIGLSRYFWSGTTVEDSTNRMSFKIKVTMMMVLLCLFPACSCQIHKTEYYDFTDRGLAVIDRYPLIVENGKISVDISQKYKMGAIEEKLDSQKILNRDLKLMPDYFDTIIKMHNERIDVVKANLRWELANLIVNSDEDCKKAYTKEGQTWTTEMESSIKYLTGSYEFCSMMFNKLSEKSIRKKKSVFIGDSCVTDGLVDCCGNVTDVGCFRYVKNCNSNPYNEDLIIRDISSMVFLYKEVGKLNEYTVKELETTFSGKMTKAEILARIALNSKIEKLIECDLENKFTEWSVVASVPNVNKKDSYDVLLEKNGELRNVNLFWDENQQGCEGLIVEETQKAIGKLMIFKSKGNFHKQGKYINVVIMKTNDTYVLTKNDINGLWKNNTKVKVGDRIWAGHNIMYSSIVYADDVDSYSTGGMVVMWRNQCIINNIIMHKRCEDYGLYYYVKVEDFYPLDCNSAASIKKMKEGYALSATEFVEGVAPINKNRTRRGLLPLGGIACELFDICDKSGELKEQLLAFEKSTIESGKIQSEVNRNVNTRFDQVTAAQIKNTDLIMGISSIFNNSLAKQKEINNGLLKAIENSETKLESTFTVAAKVMALMQECDDKKWKVQDIKDSFKYFLREPMRIGRLRQKQRSSAQELSDDLPSELLNEVRKQIGWDSVPYDLQQKLPINDIAVTSSIDKNLDIIVNIKMVITILKKIESPIFLLDFAFKPLTDGKNVVIGHLVDKDTLLLQSTNLLVSSGYCAKMFYKIGKIAVLKDNTCIKSLIKFEDSIGTDIVFAEVHGQLMPQKVGSREWHFLEEYKCTLSEVGSKKKDITILADSFFAVGKDNCLVCRIGGEKNFYGCDEDEMPIGGKDEVTKNIVVVTEPDVREKMIKYTVKEVNHSSIDGVEDVRKLIKDSEMYQKKVIETISDAEHLKIAVETRNKEMDDKFKDLYDQSVAQLHKQESIMESTKLTEANTRIGWLTILILVFTGLNTGAIIYILYTTMSKKTISEAMIPLRSVNGLMSPKETYESEDITAIFMAIVIIGLSQRRVKDIKSLIRHVFISLIALDIAMYKQTTIGVVGLSDEEINTMSVCAISGLVMVQIFIFRKCAFAGTALASKFLKVCVVKTVLIMCFHTFNIVLATRKVLASRAVSAYIINDKDKDKKPKTETVECNSVKSVNLWEVSVIVVGSIVGCAIIAEYIWFQIRKNKFKATDIRIIPKKGLNELVICKNGKCKFKGVTKTKESSALRVRKVKLWRFMRKEVEYCFPECCQVIFNGKVLEIANEDDLDSYCRDRPGAYDEIFNEVMEKYPDSKKRPFRTTRLRVEACLQMARMRRDKELMPKKRREKFVKPEEDEGESSEDD